MPAPDPRSSPDAPPEAASTEVVQARVLALLKRHGADSTSFQVLEPGYDYWFDGDDACVAYTDTGTAWVAAGGPIADHPRVPEVAHGFIRAARQHGRRARFFIVDEAFADRADLARTHIGEEPYWDPEQWPEIVQGSRSLKEQLRRARAKGVRVRVASAEEVSDPTSPVRRGMERVVRRWLGSRPMSEMGFMVLVHPFTFAEERRYVIAELEGEVIGFAAAVPVYAHDGWFVEDILRNPEAPNGTAESLVDAMMRLLAEEDAHYATLGLAPLSGDVNRVLRLTRDFTASLYNFGGVRAFKAKLKPKDWEPVYLAFPREEGGVRAMGDVLSAFAPGGVVRFCLNTLVHQRTLATRLLALLLIPWTVLLALVHGPSWFPSPLVHYGWVVFDVLLIALMFRQVRRWTSRGAILLAALTSADAAVTLLQALTYNLERSQAWWHYALIIIGVSGPLLAAAFFWATRLVAVRSKRPVRSASSLAPPPPGGK